MSRRRHRAAHGGPPAWPVPGWTIQRATGVGIVAGVLAILIGGTLDPERGTMFWLYLGLLALTALCGASVLAITLMDMRTRGTSGRMRPIRGFDMAIGAVLLLPAAYTLWLRWPAGL